MLTDGEIALCTEARRMIGKLLGGRRRRSRIANHADRRLSAILMIGAGLSILTALADDERRERGRDFVDLGVDAVAGPKSGVGQP